MDDFYEELSNFKLKELENLLPYGASNIVGLGNDWYRFWLRDSHYLIRATSSNGWLDKIDLITRA